MTDAEQIAKLIKDIYKGVYGDSEPKEAFAGGNVGLIALGLSIERAAAVLAKSIREGRQECPRRRNSRKSQM
jgi:hypothetical protein